MALVKFITNQSCRLYIDMEDIGMVPLEGMTKVTLEPGSYLIEAKDAKGNLFSRYELKINTEDTQILQNLTGVDDGIDKVIEKLQDNYELRFYNQRAVFAYKGRFGYIDSRYNVVIPPIYSYAEEFIRKCSFVKRMFGNEEKATIIDTDGNLCFGQWFDYIGDNDNQILFRRDKTYYVVKRDSYAIIKEYKGIGFDSKTKLIPVRQEIGIDCYCGYIDKTGTEIIPFIYDNVEAFEDNGFAKVKRFGNIYAIDRWGNLYHSIEEAIKDGKVIPSESDLSDNQSTKVYHAEKITKEESLVRGFDLGLDEFPVREGNEWGIGGLSYEEEFNDNGDIVSYHVSPDYKISIHRCDRILYYDYDYKVFRKNGICTLETDEENYVFSADEIILSLRWEHTFEGLYDRHEILNIIIKKNRKYGIVNIKGEIVLPIEFDFIEITNAVEKDVTGNVGIIWKDNKCTLVWIENGELFGPFKYEDILVNNVDTNLYIVNSTFLIKEKGKFGCIDFYGNIILPPIYDTINYNWEDTPDGYHYKMHLFKDGKRGFYEYCEYNILNGRYTKVDLYVEPQFDEIVLYECGEKYGVSYIFVRDCKKWGIIDKIEHLPIYSIYETADQSICHSKINKEDIDFKYNTIEDARESIKK